MNRKQVEKIKKANDIADIIGEDQTLEEQPGKENLIGYCPFGNHRDGLGKFEVNRRMQIFKCWHCEIGGDVIRYIQYRDKIKPREAIRKLAKRAGISMPKDEQFTSEINPRDLWYGVFIPDWLLRQKDIAPGAKICYGRLCRYYNPNTEQCNPKHETLAKELGVTPRTVRLYINQLIEQGLIKTKRHFGPGKPSSYGFLKHKWFADALQKPTRKKKEKDDELPFP